MNLMSTTKRLPPGRSPPILYQIELLPGFEPGTSSLYNSDKSGAGNGTQTRDPQLGRLMLYQLSYSRNFGLSRLYLLTFPIK